LRDPAFAAFDRALGFDWTAWYEFLAPRTGLRFLLWLSYLSLFPQIMLSIFWFSARGRDRRNRELLFANLVALLLTAAVFRLAPALGHPEPGRARELQILLALRAGGPWSFDLGHLEGLISFPSYHTVLAVLLIWAHRRAPLAAPVAALNTVMLLSIPTFGGHYLADMIAGAGVAGLAILATTAIRHAAAAPTPPPVAAAQRLLARSRPIP
jgi:membrane-associated phospholipid phosphatase